MVKKPRIEIFSEKNSKGKAELGFRVRSKNGRTVTSSTGYNTFQGTQKSIEALAEIMQNDPQVVDLREIKKRGRKAKVEKPQKDAAPRTATRNGHAVTSKLLRVSRRGVATSRRTKVIHGRKTSAKSVFGAAV